MGWFFKDAKDSPLRELEEKRLRFAAACEKEGFHPSFMLLISMPDGSMTGICEDCTVVRVPVPGKAGEYTAEKHRLVGRNRHYVAADGMGGVFGFGKKGEFGFDLLLENERGEMLCVPVAAGLNSCRSYYDGKDPLTSTKRRRGDMHPFLELRIIERSMLQSIEHELETIFGTLPPIVEPSKDA